MLNPLSTQILSAMIAFPNAKINLGLRILKKRSDGFHDIETCMYPIGWQDAVEIIEHGKLELSITGLEVPGDDKSNLCIRAYKLLQKGYGLPNAKIHLHKIIPFGAGLGGGSSDAAFVMKIASEIFQLFLDDDLLEEVAAELGSDCPFFIKNKPAIAGGKGNDLTILNFNPDGYYALVIYPNIRIGTALAYKNVIPSADGISIEEALSYPIAEWRNHLHNQFEDTIFPAFPLLQDIKEELYQQGAVYASMSGSGSAMFGLFKEAPQTAHWSEKGYSIWSGKL